MSKRKVQFAEPQKPSEEGDSKKWRQAKIEKTETKQVKDEGRDDIDYEDLDASGESGSEDGEGGKNSATLNMDDLEVEEKTVEYDEQVKITPFNLDEEMEDGHFDKDGTFVFNKKSVKDSWLDEYDFDDVQQLESARQAEEKKQAKLSKNEENAELADEKKTVGQIYEEIAAFLQPGESVLRAVRRLGNATKSLSASERLKLKKLAAKQGSQPAAGTAVTTDVESQKKQLARLTEMADLLIRRGQMNAYEETFESLQYQMKQLKPQSGLAASVKVAPTGDMFSDDFVDDAPVADNVTEAQDPKGSSDLKGMPSVDDDVKWEYKMSAEDDSTIHGPVLTTALMDLISAAENEDKKQPSNFYVRRHGSSGQFYISTRVDFSLYVD